MSLKDYGLDGVCLRKAIHIDTEQEYMLGDDQAFFSYPIRFPTAALLPCGLILLRQSP